MSVQGKRLVEVVVAALVFASLVARDGSAQAPPPVEFPVLSGPYLGQTPPGLTPQRFGPAAIHGNAAWLWHSSPGFSPDGLEMYWTKYVPSAGVRLQIFFMTGRSGSWTAPARAPFAGSGDENEPRFSADGNNILYISATGPGHIVRVTRTTSGWSQPVSLALPGLPSGGWGRQYCAVADGSVYVDGDLGQGGAEDLFRYPWTGSGFGPAQPVSVNTPHNEFAPYVAPDESYLIFVSNRPGGYGRHDLWIAFRQAGGTWSQPVNMGADVNSSNEDAAPYVTADGLHFFFTAARLGDAGYTPYWVSTQLIDSIRVRAGLR
jgi:hypothetical protein